MHNIFSGKNLEEIVDFFKDNILSLKENESDKNEENLHNIHEGKEDIVVSNFEKKQIENSIGIKEDKIFYDIYGDVEIIHNILQYLLAFDIGDRRKEDILSVTDKIEKVRKNLQKIADKIGIEIETEGDKPLNINSYYLAIKLVKEKIQNVLDNLILFLFLMQNREIFSDTMLVIVTLMTISKKIEEMLIKR